jgi:hypothetical protein
MIALRYAFAVSGRVLLLHWSGARGGGVKLACFTASLIYSRNEVLEPIIDAPARYFGSRWLEPLAG